MNQEQRQAYEWAKNQDYQSVAARYAKILAGLIDEMNPPNEPLTCTGCMYSPDCPSEIHCFGCARLYTDNYRRPPEGEEGHHG